MKQLILFGFFILVLTTIGNAQINNTSIETINGVPTICLNNQPYKISGWTVATLGGYWELSADEIMQEMDSAKNQGFEVVEFLVPWQKIEWVKDQYDWSKTDSLMEYAETIELYGIIQIVATIAPPWFADTFYPDAVFTTYDPDSAIHTGEMWGRLAIQGEGSFPIFYHPGYYEQIDTFIVNIINRYKNHPSLFGWTLGLWFTGEYNYPGAGYGIAGFADYSPYTESLYGTPPPYPLNMFSQSGPDTRTEWNEWTKFRIEKKRETLQHFASYVKSLDPYHILIGYPGGGLWGELDNGYISEVVGMDYVSMLMNPDIDVIRGAPQVSENLFSVINNEISLVPYLMMANIQASYRNGKPYILQNERSLDTTSLTQEIIIWSEYHKSFGCDLLWWEEPDSNNISGNWSTSEKAEIGNTRNISDLPNISALTKSDFAFVDLPFEVGKYYTDDTYSLMFAMKQAKAFMDAGLPFDCISEEEILENPSVLNSYKAIGFLFPDMYNLLAPDTLKNIISNYTGAIWNGSPLDGYLYHLSEYSDTNYLNTLRLFYDANNLVRNNYTGYFVYIAGNKPFVFILSRDNNFSGNIEVNIKGWSLADGNYIFMEYNTSTNYSVSVNNDIATFSINLNPQEPCLFILDTLTDIEKNELFNFFPKIFPNPTTGIFTITGENIQSIEITNISGQIIYSSDDFKSSDECQFQVDLSSQPKGIYFIKIKNNNLNIVKKIVIQ